MINLIKSTAFAATNAACTLALAAACEPFGAFADRQFLASTKG
jgi:hypothetical protein